MSFAIAVNLGLLAAVFASSIVMIDRMNRGTRGAIRWGAALLFVGTIAEGAGYVWHWASWTDTLFIGGAGMCLIANLRFPSGSHVPYAEWTEAQRAASERKSNLCAYAVGALTVLGLLFSWATS